MSTRMKWTSKQEEFIIANYETMPPRDIAAHLGCAVKSVYDKACRMGLRRPEPAKPERVPRVRERCEIPEKVRLKLEVAPMLPVDVLLNGRHNRRWKDSELKLYLQALVVQVGRVAM